MAKKISLRSALRLFGAQNIEFTKGTYNYRSGFFDKGGQLYYFSTTDIRGGTPDVMIRTAKHRRDYTGGTNDNCSFPRFLRENGFELNINRTKQDYNGN